MASYVKQQEKDTVVCSCWIKEGLEAGTRDWISKYFSHNLQKKDRKTVYSYGGTEWMHAISLQPSLWWSWLRGTKKVLILVLYGDPEHDPRCLDKIRHCKEVINNAIFLFLHILFKNVSTGSWHWSYGILSTASVDSNTILQNNVPKLTYIVGLITKDAT